MRIAIVADKDTVTCFRLAGLECAYPVESAEEAEKRIREYLEKYDFSIIITTEHIANRIRDTITEITEEHEYPLIISIPNVGDPSLPLLDPIVELIRRKTGIELRL